MKILKISLIRIFVLCVILLQMSSCVDKTRNNPKEVRSCQERVDLMSRLFILNLQYAKNFNLNNAQVFNEQRIEQSLNILGSKKMVFFRITDRNCDECIQAELRLIKKQSQLIKENKIALLISSKDFSYLEIFKKINNVNLPTYFISFEDINDNSVEDLNVPYYFGIEPKGLIKLFFIPDKKLPALSMSYFNLFKN